MTALELAIALLQCDNLNSIVTVGKGCGPVEHLTETVNGFVIIDPRIVL